MSVGGWAADQISVKKRLPDNQQFVDASHQYHVTGNDHQEDLDKLIEGLEKLTESLPDVTEEPQNRLQQQRLHNRSPDPAPPRPPLPDEASLALGGQDRYVTTRTQPILVDTTINDQLDNPYPSVRRTRQLLQQRQGSVSSVNRELDPDDDKDPEVGSRPYHTLQHSKPFSYIRSNPGSMPSSRNLSRASSKEALMANQPGLQSPGLLRKIMGMPNSRRESVKSDDDDDFLPSANANKPKSFPQSGSISNNNNKGRTINIQVDRPQFMHTPPPNEPFNKDFLNDFNSSMSWLEKQQRKLQERRDMEKRREQLGKVANRSAAPLDPSSIYYPSRSETTDGYASDVASMLYSEPSSTRESSPHKQQHNYQQQQQQPVINIPVRVESSSYNNKTLWDDQDSSRSYRPTLTRQKSDISFDRSGSPYGQTWKRRLRYDSDTESEVIASNLFQQTQRLNGGSNTSLDSASWQTIGSGSRPTTPAFPHSFTLSRNNSLYRNNGSLRAPSPAGSFYQGAGSRRGSFSSEPAEVSPMHVKLVKDHHRYWYKPTISRDEAIAILKSCPPGSFIVRDSNSYPGAFGLALRVASPPLNASRNPSDPSSDLVRHFLIEPTSKGVKLKGYANEPVFASLSALVYQHTVTQLALPTRLVLPQSDMTGGRRDSTDSKSSNSQLQHLLSVGAACNVNYLLTIDTDSLTGPAAVKKAVSAVLKASDSVSSLVVHFKVSGQGITLTDQIRKRFFRRHFPTASISHCGMDPEDRRWDSAHQRRIFAVVAKRPGSRTVNQCHVFAEHDPDQPASAIVNFVNKVMLSAANGSKKRGDIV